MKTIRKPIEMISWTEIDGSIHPLRFKIECHDGEKQMYKVNRVFTKKLDRIAGNLTYKFDCEVNINALMKLCEIRYEVETCKWVLFKI